MKTISSSECSRISVDHLGHPLLEVTAVARAGDHARQVELDDPLALELLGDVAVDDALGDALDDRGLADARLTDEHGVVLGAARQHLEGLVDLVVAAHHRVQLAGPRLRGQVDAELVEGRGAGVGVVAATGATLPAARALTTGRGGALQRLRGDALGAERAAHRAVVVRGQREHDVLGADVAGAERAGDLVRVEQRALGRRRQRRRVRCGPRRAAAARRRCGPGPRGRRLRRTAAGAAAAPG